MPPNDINDQAHDVVLRALRYDDNVRIENSQGFVPRLASNLARELRERLRFRRSHDHCRPQELQIESTGESKSAVAKLRGNAYLQAAVDRLPPMQRDVLLLHVNEGLTSERIAQLRGLKHRNVVRDLTHAYAQLRRDVKLEDL